MNRTALLVLSSLLLTPAAFAAPLVADKQPVNLHAIAMFFVFGRISVSAECTSRYTTRIISMSIIGISVSGPCPPPDLP